jgi:hypothetical protein
MVGRNMFLYPVLERSALFRSPLVCSFVTLNYHTLGDLPVSCIKELKYQSSAFPKRIEQISQNIDPEGTQEV